MTPAEKAQIRQIIKDRLQETRIEIGRLQSASKPVAPDNALGRLTRLDAMQSREMANAGLRNAELLNNRLGVLLQRIDDAEFGICIECEEAIGTDRLKAMPEAARCVRCAQ